MKKMKAPAILSIVFAILFLFAACGTPAGPAATPTPAPATPAPAADATPTPEQAPQEPPAQGLTGEIVYWSNWNNTENQGQVLAEAAKEFEEANPGVKITIVYNGRENRKVVLPALESGQQVDMMDQNIDFSITTWKDYLLNMDEYYKKEYPSTNGLTLYDALLPLYTDLARSKDENGSLYGIPYQPNVWSIYYNKDHFAQAGIDKVPATWEEFMAACEKLKAAGFIPMTTDDAYADILLGFHLCRYKGADWIKSLVNGDESWDDPQVVQAIKDFEEMVSKGYFPSTIAANIFPAGQQEIAIGEVSMYLNGSFLINEVMATAGEDFNWGAFSYPAVPGGVDGPETTVVGSQVMCVNKNTAHPDTAMAFAAFISTGKYDEMMSSRTYGIPMDQGNPWPKQLEDVKGIFSHTSKRYPSSTTIRSNSDKSSIIKEEFIKLLGGTITADQFIAAMK